MPTVPLLSCSILCLFYVYVLVDMATVSGHCTLALVMVGFLSALFKDAVDY